MCVYAACVGVGSLSCVRDLIGRPRVVAVNEIGAAGVASLSEALKVNATVTSIDLRCALCIRLAYVFCITLVSSRFCWRYGWFRRVCRRVSSCIRRSYVIVCEMCLRVFVLRFCLSCTRLSFGWRVLCVILCCFACRLRCLACDSCSSSALVFVL